MTIYVLAMATRYTDSGCVNIDGTYIYRTLKEAQDAMYEDSEMYLQDEDEEWSVDYDNGITMRITSNKENAVSWAISEHEI